MIVEQNHALILATNMDGFRVYRVLQKDHHMILVIS